MTIRGKKIKHIIEKIESVSVEDLNKVEAYVDGLYIDENESFKENSDKHAKRLRIEDFSFSKAKKLTENLKSALADEVVKEREITVL